MLFAIEQNYHFNLGKIDDFKEISRRVRSLLLRRKKGFGQFFHLEYFRFFTEEMGNFWVLGLFTVTSASSSDTW